MQQFKSLVSDFDGTLCDVRQGLSPRVVEAVKKWISSGKYFSIASGRQFVGFKEYAVQMGLKDPVIACGGAEIIDPLSGKVLWQEHMNRETAHAIVKLLIEHNIPFVAARDDMLYTHDGKPHAFRPMITYKHINEMNTSIPKIVMLTNDLDEKMVEDFVKHKLEAHFDTIHIIKAYSPVGKCWDITSLKATKQLAVLHLAEILHITPDEMIGIGDGYNDYPLLTAAGYKVAMGNANEDLKAIADEVIGSCENEGIADFIEKLLSGT